jgi:hypothetical protein
MVSSVQDIHARARARDHSDARARDHVRAGVVLQLFLLAVYRLPFSGLK